MTHTADTVVRHTQRKGFLIVFLSMVQENIYFHNNIERMTCSRYSVCNLSLENDNLKSNLKGFDSHMTRENDFPAHVWRE